MATPTSCVDSAAEPLGTDSANALNCNSSTLDSIVNGTETVVSRIGKSLSSLTQIESNYLMTAINGGVWAAGQTFTAFNQYMVFGSTAYKAKFTTMIPYIVGAAPDLLFVEPVPSIYIDLANNQTGLSYTLVSSDNSKTIWMNNASPNVLTIPDNASVPFGINDVIMVMMEGAGTTTITADVGVTLNGVVAGSADINAQYSGATLIKRSADVWVVTGNVGVVS